jgi:hypothetical protein
MSTTPPRTAHKVSGVDNSQGMQHAQYVEDRVPIHGCRHELVEEGTGHPSRPRSLFTTSQPIQNVRRTVKQHIKTHPKFPSTIEKTKVGLREEWDRLQPSEFNE